MLKKIALSALLISCLFSQTVFAKGALTLDNVKTGTVVKCSIGDKFSYNTKDESKNKNNDKAVMLNLSIDLTQVGTKRFNIVLEGAVWDDTMTEGSFDYIVNQSMPYEGSEGITYRRQTDTTLGVKIDGAKVDKRIIVKVPLNCVVTGNGDVRAYLDGVAFSKTNDNIIFADSAKSMEELPDIQEQDAVIPDAAAELEAQERTEAATEEITEETTEEITEEITEEATEETTEEAVEEVTEEETEEPAAPTEPKSISFVANGDMYYINGEEFETDTPAYISETGYTMLPLRLFAEALDVNDIEYFDETKTAQLTLKNHSRISITAYENSYTIDSLKLDIDGCAEIKEDRLYLPLRAMVNAFGISNDYIDFDAETKTVTINVR